MGADNVYTWVRYGIVGDAYTPANKTADLVSLNMAAPVRSVSLSDTRDNPKTPNRSDVYIYNYVYDLLEMGYYQFTYLSGRQLDKTESFFLVARLQIIFIWTCLKNLQHAILLFLLLYIICV